MLPSCVRPYASTDRPPIAVQLISRITGEVAPSTQLSGLGCQGSRLAGNAV
jgi:hypothetical protein